MGAAAGGPIPLSTLLVQLPNQPAAAFWASVISRSPPRVSLPLADPKELNSLAKSRPDQFKQLALLSAQSVKTFADYTGTQFPEAKLNELAWALNMFTTVLEVALYNPDLYTLLFDLDAALAAQYLVANPTLVKSPKQRRKILAFSQKPPSQPAKKKAVQPPPAEVPDASVKPPTEEPTPTEEPPTKEEAPPHIPPPTDETPPEAEKLPTDGPPPPSEEEPPPADQDEKTPEAPHEETAVAVEEPPPTPPAAIAEDEKEERKPAEPGAEAPAHADGPPSAEQVANEPDAPPVEEPEAPPSPENPADASPAAAKPQPKKKGKKKAAKQEGADSAPNKTKKAAPTPANNPPPTSKATDLGVPGPAPPKVEVKPAPKKKAGKKAAALKAIDVPQLTPQPEGVKTKASTAAPEPAKADVKKSDEDAKKPPAKKKGNKSAETVETPPEPTAAQADAKKPDDEVTKRPPKKKGKKSTDAAEPPPLPPEPAKVDTKKPDDETKKPSEEATKPPAKKKGKKSAEAAQPPAQAPEPAKVDAKRPDDEAQKPSEEAKKPPAKKKGKKSSEGAEPPVTETPKTAEPPVGDAPKPKKVGKKAAKAQPDDPTAQSSEPAPEKPAAAPKKKAPKKLADSLPAAVDAVPASELAPASPTKTKANRAASVEPSSTPPTDPSAAAAVAPKKKKAAKRAAPAPSPEPTEKPPEPPVEPPPSPKEKKKAPSATEPGASRPKRQPRRSESVPPPQAKVPEPSPLEFPPDKEKKETAVKAGSAPVETLEIPVYPAMLGLAGNVVDVFAASVQACLFKRGLTTGTASGLWLGLPTEPILNRTRRDLVHALVGISSISFFVPASLHRPSFTLSLSGFPHTVFLKSIGQVGSQYIQGLEANHPDPILGDLLRNSLALATRLFAFPEFRTTLAKQKPAVLVKVFGSTAHSLPLFDPAKTLSSEALSLLYMSALCQPGFVKWASANGYSNSFIFHVLHIAQLNFEKVGFSILHSIALSAILLFVPDTRAAASLDQDWSGDFGLCDFKPQPGSHADLLVNVLLNICQQESFWPSLVAALQMIAPYASRFSPATGTRVVKLFVDVLAKQRPLAELFVEAFAAVAQVGDEANGILVALRKKGKFIRSLTRDQVNSDALEIVQQNLKKKKEGVEVVGFPRHPHIFGGELEGAWKEWSTTLFVRSFQAEIEAMQLFQKELEPLLAAKSAK